jgi:hypothetical protein
VSVSDREKVSPGTRTVTNTHKFLGDHGEGDPPVPIPNTEVKPFSADGTAWVTVWESRTLPRLKLVLAKAGNEKPVLEMGFFVLNSNFVW